MFKNRLKESQQVWLPFRPPSTTNPLRLNTHPRSNYHTHPIVILEIPAMTARQSYHLTFSRFSPSLSVKSFTASEAANTAYRVEITATSTDSSLPLSSYLNQRAAFEIRPQEAVLSEVAAAFSAGSDAPPQRNNGRALLPHARSCRYPRMKPFTALF